MKLKDYLEKVYNELAPNEVEIVGTQQGGLNVQGSLGGQDMQQLFQKFINELKKQNKPTEGPMVKQLFIAWIQKTHPDVWKAIQAKGGFDKLLGNKPPSDIIVQDAGEKKGIVINPDA